jgi:sugar lactone lactonase YvrE
VTPRRFAPAVLATLVLSAACIDYGDVAVPCDPQGAKCPTDFACLDPFRSGVTTCVRIGCGDGQIGSAADANDAVDEQCDDANDSRGDLCDPKTCRTAQFCPAVQFGELQAARARDAPCVTIDDCGQGEVCDAGRCTVGDVRLGRPFLVTTDAVGNLFASSSVLNFIARRGVDGAFTRFAGNGSSVSVGLQQTLLPDDISTAVLSAIAADGVGNLVIADPQANFIRRIDAVTGDVEDVIGDGTPASSPDGVPARGASVSQPITVAFDAEGTLYFIERLAPLVHRVRRISPGSGVLETIAPIDRTAAGDIDIDLDAAGDIDFDATGSLWVLLIGGDGLVRVDVDGSAERVNFASSCAAELAAGQADELVLPSQARLAVEPDGRHAYFLRGDNVVRVATTTGECAVLMSGEDVRGPGLVVGEQIVRSCPTPLEPDDEASVFGNSPLLATGVADLALHAAGDGSVRLYVADPMRGIVTFLDLEEGAPRTGPQAFGRCFTGPDGEKVPVDSLIADGLLALSGETDGRVSLAETNACCTPQVDGTCTPRPLIAFERYQFFLPSPLNHAVGSLSCQQDLDTVAGIGIPGYDGDAPRPARSARLDAPIAATSALNEDIFISDAGNARVRRVRRYASGAPAGCADDELCIEPYVPPCPSGAAEDAACVHQPAGLAVDATGALLVVDTGPAGDDDGGRILRIPAGADAPVGETSGVTVIASGLREPTAMAFLKYRLAGEDFIPGVAAACSEDAGTAPTDPCGFIVLAERGAHRIQTLLLPPFPGTNGQPVAFDIAGDGTPGDDDDVDDDPANTARLRAPRGLMIDAPKLDAATTDQLEIGLLVIDSIERVRRVAVDISQGAITSALLGGAIPSRVETLSPRRSGQLTGFPARDDAADDKAFLRSPSRVAFLADGRQFLLDRVTGRLRLVTVAGNDPTCAGCSPTTVTAVETVSGRPGGVVVGADDVAAADAEPLASPEGIVIDGDIVYVAEADTGRIRVFDIADPDAARWTTRTLALDDDVLEAPAALSFDPKTGTLFVADRAAHAVFAVDPLAGTIREVVGERNRRGFAGDAFAAPDCSEQPADGPVLLNAPEGLLFVERAGRRWLYVADTGNNRVRRVELDEDGALRSIATVVGDGAASSGGRGAPARDFPVDAPRGLAVDGDGNLFVTSSTAIRLVQADSFVVDCAVRGVADGLDQVDTIYGEPPFVGAEQVTRCLVDIVVDPSSPAGATRLLAVDSCIGMVVQLIRTTDDVCPVR